MLLPDPDQRLCEVTAKGFPPFGRVGFVYAVVLLCASVLSCGGGALRLSVGPWSAPVPALFPALVVLCAAELVRVARWRGRRYVVTREALYTVEGLTGRVRRFGRRSHGLRWAGAYVYRGANARSCTLAGLDVLDLQTLARALDQPIGAPPAAPSRRVWALALALALVGVEAYATWLRAAREAFEARADAFERALSRAEAAGRARLRARYPSPRYVIYRSAGPVFRSRGSFLQLRESTVGARVRPTVQGAGGRFVVVPEVHVVMEQPWALLPDVDPPVLLRREATDGSELLAEEVARTLREEGFEVVEVAQSGARGNRSKGVGRSSLVR